MVSIDDIFNFIDHFQLKAPLPAPFRMSEQLRRWQENDERIVDSNLRPPLVCWDYAITKVPKIK